MFIDIGSFLRQLAVGVQYRCRCKTRDHLTQKIYFGDMFQKSELFTNKLLKKVQEGFFGKEWQQLLDKYPGGTVDSGAELYVCEKCGYWINEEKVDFYLPLEKIDLKSIVLREDKYKLLKKYTHKCPKCESSMKEIGLVEYLKDNSYEDNYKTVYDLQLTCPKCKEKIKLISCEIHSVDVEYRPDKIMEVIDADLRHKKWGIGKVVNFAGEDIVVDFPEKKGVIIKYPEAITVYKVAEFVSKSLQKEVLQKWNENHAGDKENTKGIVKKDEPEVKSVAEKKTQAKGDQRIVPRITSDNVMTYLVFQGTTYDAECAGGYIWAPLRNQAGHEVHHWKRLEDVRKGDIILHANKGFIQAISVAEGEAYSCSRPGALDEADQWEKDGLKVDCQYTLLRKPINYRAYKDVTKNYSGVKYAPFNSAGNGNQGYLFELNKELAKFFIDLARKNNSEIDDKFCL